MKIAKIEVLGLILCALFLTFVIPTQAQQQQKIPRIGFLSSFSASNTAGSERAFCQGLRELGWTEGKHISIEYRYSEGKAERLPELATELVRLKVDVIV